MTKELKSVRIIKQLKANFDKTTTHQRASTFGMVNEQKITQKDIAQLLKEFMDKTRQFQTDTQRNALKRAIDENWR